jgi:hypothetical protein
MSHSFRAVFSTRVISGQDSALGSVQGPLRVNGFCRRITAVVALFVSLAAMVAIASTASAAQTPSAAWDVNAFSVPTTFAPRDNALCLETLAGLGQCDKYHVTVTDSGSAAADGSPIEIRETLSENVEVRQIHFEWSGLSPVVCEGSGCGPEADLAPLLCVTEGKPVEVVCRFGTEGFGLPPVQPDDHLNLDVNVTTDEGATDAPSSVVVSGGGGATQTGSVIDTPVSESHLAFGLSALAVGDNGLAGRPDREAGGHPYEFSTEMDFNTVGRVSATGATQPTSIEDPKDVVVDLPLGFLGSAVATPTCTLAEMSAPQHGCPPGTVVGHIRSEPEPSHTSINGPLYNIVPEPGVAAEFGYVDALKSSHEIVARVVPGPHGYFLRAEAKEVPQVPLTSVTTTFWGNPGAKDGSSFSNAPMFTNPASCSDEPLSTVVHIDSWQHPGRRDADGEPDFSDPAWTTATAPTPSMTECNALAFTPTVTPELETTNADSPTGLALNVAVPQSENFFARATPPLRAATVALPAGLTLNPAAAAGLAACSPAEIGLGTTGAPSCPAASKVGSVEVTTPLLGHVLPGSVYLATQDENPFGSVVAAYIVINDAPTGTLVKIPGKIVLNEAGEVTGDFEESPQLPFSLLKLKFFGGTHGDLMTPEGCGSYSVSSKLTPWSAEGTGLQGTPFTAQFGISGNCATGFAPTFAAGTISPRAGGYSPFVLSYGRSDTDQELSGLTVSLPPGLLAKLAGVGLCSDAELAAAAGRSGREEQATPSCSASSALGDVSVQAGAGPTPYEVAGKIYLTGPYRGAPYGLAVVVPALAGPYDFGTVVVRQALEVDPLDAHATVVSDPFPSVLKVRGADGVVDGFPLRIKNVAATIDRPDFTVNPTDCGEKAIGGVGTSSGGVAVALNSRFQASDCASLGFRPKLVVSTSGKTSKAKGASLNVKLTYPQGPQGTYANIARVKVDLPKQLPSQLKTLQKACTAAQFNTNPAGCPAESKVGFATVHTPILPAPLSGPAIFVSHGNEAFPSLTMVLQGDNVTLDLVGTTFISKAGITSSTFKAVPDAPVSSFELNLPQGKYSALTANGNLCKSRLAMPTEFLAQNGAKINESTPIGVTGCAKVKALTRPQKLAAALKACHKKPKAKHAGCEKQARKKYGPIGAKKKAKK